jgi:hypothetical protein
MKQNAIFTGVPVSSIAGIETTAAFLESVSSFSFRFGSRRGVHRLKVLRKEGLRC